MHFQAGSRSLFPIAKETAILTSITVPNYKRNVFLFRASERSILIDRIDRAVDRLGEVTGKQPEPLVNIALYHEKGEWVTYLFPRGKHRPEVFYKGEMIVSPASIDLCGIFVVPLARNFERITAETIASIFSEVTLPDDQFRAASLSLARERLGEGSFQNPAADVSRETSAARPPHLRENEH